MVATAFASCGGRVVNTQRVAVFTFIVAITCWSQITLAQNGSNMDGDIEGKLVELVQLYEAKYPGDAPEKITAFEAAAKTYRQIGKPAKAVPLYEKILEIRKATEKTPSVERVNTLSDLSMVYAVVERYDDAATILSELIKLLTSYYPDDGAALYSAMNSLAACYQGLKKYSEAEKAYLNILKLDSTVLKARKKSIAATYHNLGVLYYQTKDFAKSEHMLLTALSLKKQLWGPSHTDVGLTLRTLANTYRLRGQTQKATQLKAEADAILGDEPASGK
jgi:tetratricopeptide (TPR) repeat protein